MKIFNKVNIQGKIKAGQALVLSLIVVLTGSVYLWGLLQKKPSGLKMNHKIHAENDVACSACHSVDSNTRFMTFKGHDACSECHDQVKSSNKEDCKICHTNSEGKTALRKNINLSPLVNFDHKTHVEGGVKCIQCHISANIEKSVFGNNMIPRMETCVECHKDRKIADTDDCSTCHVDGYERIRPADHTPFWFRNHGRGLDSVMREKSCNICHTKKLGNDCLSCHRREKPKNHTIGWRVRSHAQYAQINRESCVTCHTQGECIACHTTNEPFSHTGFWGAPYNRHCINCHVTGGDFSGASGIQNNCTFCHRQGTIVSRHTTLPRPSGHSTSGCSDNGAACHNGRLGLRHPYPTSTFSCRSCHQ